MTQSFPVTDSFLLYVMDGWMCLPDNPLIIQALTVKKEKKIRVKWQLNHWVAIIFDYIYIFSLKTFVSYFIFSDIQTNTLFIVNMLFMMDLWPMSVLYMHMAWQGVSHQIDCHRNVTQTSHPSGWTPVTLAISWLFISATITQLFTIQYSIWPNICKMNDISISVCLVLISKS